MPSVSAIFCIIFVYDVDSNFIIKYTYVFLKLGKYFYSPSLTKNIESRSSIVVDLTVGEASKDCEKFSIFLLQTFSFLVTS